MIYGPFSAPCCTDCMDLKKSPPRSFPKLTVDMLLLKTLGAGTWG